MGESKVEMHELRLAQHAEVRALILAGLAEHWGTVDPALNRDLDDLVAAYPEGITLVAVEGESVVGTGTIVRRGQHAAEIVRMSVAPAHRRTGLGRQLVANLLEQAREWEIERVVLETSAAWTDVVDFYVGCGFTLTHFLDGEFGRDAWFVLRLS